MTANFKDKLKEKRKKFTQKGLADKLGISQTYISKILRGDRVPGLKLEKRLKKELAKL